MEHTQTVRSLSAVAQAKDAVDPPLRLALFGAYTCLETRSAWRVCSAVESVLGEKVDLRFGHVFSVHDAAASRAAEAAEAAGAQDAFGSMHRWLVDNPEGLSGGNVAAWAYSAGLDVPRFSADLWEGASASVRSHALAARALGVDAGPSLWIGGSRYTGLFRVAAILSACAASHRPGDAVQTKDERDVGLPCGEHDTRDAWLALAGHELRSPFAALYALVELIAAGNAAGVAPNAHFIVVRQVLGRIRRLIEQMTTTASLRGDHTDPPPSERVELGSVVRSVVEALRYEQPMEHRIVVHASRPVYGTWPPGWVEQVISNLVANAIKFGAGAPVDVEVTSEGALATLVVRDRGKGFAVEDLPRLMRPYERGAHTAGVPGLGLGLHVVGTLVEAMGGSVNVDSAPGCGASFRVDWPTNGNPRC